jgi:hypothetical protein
LNANTLWAIGSGMKATSNSFPDFVARKTKWQKSNYPGVAFLVKEI